MDDLSSDYSAFSSESQRLRYLNDKRKSEKQVSDMILAIKAPYGSTVEIPCEQQIKEFHNLSKNRGKDIHIQNNSILGNTIKAGLDYQSEEYEDLMKFL